MNRKRVEALETLLKQNFKEGTMITLTYQDEPSDKEAIKRLEKLKRQLWRTQFSHNDNSAYLAITGGQKAKLHHYLICNDKITKEAAQEAWRYGFVDISTMQGQDMGKLAEYLLKGFKRSQRYSHSLKPAR